MRSHYSSEVKPDADGEKVKVAGWIHEVRDLGNLKFVIVRDREGFIQVTAKKGETDEDVLESVNELSRESVVSVSGVVSASDKAPGGVEIKPDGIEVVTSSQTPLPLDVTGKVDADLDTRLNNRFMDVRKPEVMGIFRIRAKVQESFRDYFLQKDFIEITPPTIIAAASEGGTNLFPITYFEREAFLAQSPQLYKQIIMSTGLDKVLITQPVFRAEPHNTPRHLNEIYQMDIEKAFIEDEEGVIEELEGATHHILEKVSKECSRELDLLDIDLDVPDLPFKRLTYDKSLDILAGKGIDLEWGSDIPPDGEKALNRYFNDQPFIIKEWPTEIRAFYSRPLDFDPDKCGAFDLDYKGMELASGAQRIHTYDKLVNALEKKDLEPEDFDFYLKAFKYGMPPHGGWSIGAERITQAIVGARNIRECVLWPRDRHRITP